MRPYIILLVISLGLTLDCSNSLSYADDSVPRTLTKQQDIKNMAPFSDLPLGILSTPKKPELTLEQINEALDVTEQCTSSTYMSGHYNCDCLGMKLLELRQNEPITTLPILISQAQKKCPNSVGVAGITYVQCQTWAQVSRPYDYKDFCACVANGYARLYEANTSDHAWAKEAQLTKAYVECDGGKMLQERLQQENKIKDIKEKNQFYKLFPGAEQQDKTTGIGRQLN